MLVSYNWLKEYIREKGEGKRDKLNPQEIFNVLNTRSFEVEGVEERRDDFILDVKITPNRAHDCACHVGIAKEVAINCDLEFKYENPKFQQGSFDTNFQAEISDKRCLRYMLREVRNVEVADSNPDLKKKMESLGEKSINNVVDITNIVLFELGQPMHAFDKDKLTGTKISARTSKIGESMDTLDNNFVEFDDDTCVIADSEPIAIAGIKGGKKAEVDNNTKNLILESANFFASQIRQTSNKIGISTESSKRYEIGITPELTEIAMNRATELLLKYGGPNVEISNVVDIYPRPASPYYTGVSLEEINNLLGLNLALEEVKNIFDKLGFEYQYLNTKEFVTEEIKKHLNTPHNTFPSLTYDAPKSFDCSTLTAYVYAHGGKSIPRLTIDQLFFGKEVSKDDLEPGDLIFSNSENGNIRYDTVNFIPGNKFEKGVDHVGMYIDNGKIIHSTRKIGHVIEEELETSESFKNIVAYRRIVEKDEMRFAVRIPDLRMDLRNSADLIEEVGRIYGYENIESKEIKNLKPVKNSNQEAFAILKIKSVLQRLGFSEVYTSSFADNGDVKILKALAKDKNYLRISIEEGIMKALTMGHYNADLIAIDRVQIYEIGKVFPKGVETLVLGLGVKNKNLKKPKTGEILREIIAKLQEDLRFKIQDLKIKDEDEFVQIELTDLIEKIDINEEIKLDFNYNHKYQKLSQYPFVSRDIAVWIKNGKGNQDDIFEIVEKYSRELLRTKRLFDVFEKEGRTSFAVRVVFQSNEKTLNDEEVGEIMNKVYEELKAKEGFEIR